MLCCSQMLQRHVISCANGSLSTAHFLDIVATFWPVRENKLGPVAYCYIDRLALIPLRCQMFGRSLAFRFSKLKEVKVLNPWNKSRGWKEEPSHQLLVEKWPDCTLMSIAYTEARDPRDRLEGRMKPAETNSLELLSPMMPFENRLLASFFTAVIRLTKWSKYSGNFQISKFRGKSQ